jgi:tetratricopeptide (TPR) repeat protein
MRGLNLKKISYGINLVQYSIGEFLFPFLEPIFRTLENKRKEVRGNFLQAIENIEKNNLHVALLNLNAVLNLRPKHFLARVYRGRIYIQLRQLQRASDDYLFADQVSHYRFIHYDLYREYLRSVNKEVEKSGASIIQNFTQAFEVLRQAHEKFTRKGKDAEKSPLSRYEADMENDLTLFEEEGLSDEEMTRFEKMGPISREEIENTDWEKVIKKIIS